MQGAVPLWTFALALAALAPFAARVWTSFVEERAKRKTISALASVDAGRERSR